jgi:hypothetical protein
MKPDVARARRGTAARRRPRLHSGLRSRLGSNTGSSTRMRFHGLPGFYVRYLRLKSGDLSLHIDTALVHGQLIDFTGTNKGPDALQGHSGLGLEPSEGG